MAGPWALGIDSFCSCLDKMDGLCSRKRPVEAKPAFLYMMRDGLPRKPKAKPESPKSPLQYEMLSDVDDDNDDDACCSPSSSGDESYQKAGERRRRRQRRESGIQVTRAARQLLLERKAENGGPERLEEKSRPQACVQLYTDNSVRCLGSELNVLREVLSPARKNDISQQHFLQQKLQKPQKLTCDNKENEPTRLPHAPSASHFVKGERRPDNRVRLTEAYHRVGLNPQRVPLNPWLPDSHMVAAAAAAAGTAAVLSGKQQPSLDEVKKRLSFSESGSSIRHTMSHTVSHTVSHTMSHDMADADSGDAINQSPGAAVQTLMRTFEQCFVLGTPNRHQQETMPGFAVPGRSHGHDEHGSTVDASQWSCEWWKVRRAAAGDRRGRMLGCYGSTILEEAVVAGEAMRNGEWGEVEEVAAAASEGEESSEQEEEDDEGDEEGEGDDGSAESEEEESGENSSEEEEEEEEGGEEEEEEEEDSGSDDEGEEENGEDGDEEGDEEEEGEEEEVEGAERKEEQEDEEGAQPMNQEEASSHQAKRRKLPESNGSSIEPKADKNVCDGNKLYVGGLPYDVEDVDIHSFFASCGNIAAIERLTFPDSGRFRGIAFITFRTARAAAAALQLDGADMSGRFLKVKPCRPAAAAPAKQAKAEAPHVGDVEKVAGNLRAYIGNLSWDVDEASVRSFFGSCKIKSVRFAEDRETGQFKGFGHVDFEDDESLEMAVKRNQQLLLGRPMKVAYSVALKQQSTNGGMGNKHKGKDDWMTKKRKTVREEYGGGAHNEGHEMGGGMGDDVDAGVDEIGRRGKKAKRLSSSGCFVCGGEGHKSYDCPQKDSRSKRPRKS